MEKATSEPVKGASLVLVTVARLHSTEVALIQRVRSPHRPRDQRALNLHWARALPLRETPDADAVLGWVEERSAVEGGD